MQGLITAYHTLLQSLITTPKIALGCGLKVRIGYQDRLCVNSDADETLA